MTSEAERVEQGRYDEFGALQLTTTEARFFDEGWAPGSGARPSTIFGMRLCVIATARDGGESAAEAFLRSSLSVARQRWRDGYYADPMTHEPQVRAHLLAKEVRS